VASAIVGRFDDPARPDRAADDLVINIETFQYNHTTRLKIPTRDEYFVIHDAAEVVKQTTQISLDNGFKRCN